MYGQLHGKLVINSFYMGSLQTTLCQAHRGLKIQGINHLCCGSSLSVRTIGWIGMRKLRKYVWVHCIKPPVVMGCVLIMRPHYHCRDTSAMLLGPVRLNHLTSRHDRSFNVTVHLQNRETFICQDKRTAQDKPCKIFITFHNHNFNITLKSHLPNC